MHVIYSPEYSGENVLPITADQSCLLNTLYVENSGLLAQLELRLGLSTSMLSDVERESHYLLSLRKHKQGAFYETAAIYDELGTARKLLQWRDNLILAGWSANVVGISKKLDDLAEMEVDFHCPGISDRWLAINTFAKTKDFQLDEFQLTIDCQLDALPWLITDTLNTLQSHGLILEVETTSEAIAPSGSNLHKLQLHLLSNSAITIDRQDDSLQLLVAPNQNDVFDWFATTSHPGKTVAVNRDSILLNQVLASWNQPNVYAKSEKNNPQVTQLFKLGLSLFIRPLNIYNTVAYLQMPVHPLPAKLRHQLVNCLCETGGIDKQWFQLLNEYVYDEDHKKDAQLRKKKQPFWEIITLQEKDIHKETIAAYNSALMQWANSYSRIEGIDTNLSDQLTTLISFCKAFSTALTGMENINDEQISELIRSIYRPTTYVQQHAQVDAVTTLADITQLASETDHLVWLDCCNQSLDKDTYDFLNLSERKKLQQIGVAIPSYEDKLRNQRNTLIRSICRVKQSLVIVIPQYIGNQLAEAHPFYTELKQLFKPGYTYEQPLTLNPDHSELRTIDHRMPQTYYEIEGLELPVRTQSHTSIDTLIQHPFDYLLRYVAKLREPASGQLKDIGTTFGEVAHLFIQELFTDANYQLSTIKEYFAKEFELRIQRAIQEIGTILLLKENQNETNSFIQQLKESTATLLSIIEYYQLQPIGCEVEVTLKDLLGYGPFTAKIDCVLQNRQKKYVIFDFKWSESKSFAEKITNNTATQLALYKYALEHSDDWKGTVEATAYYLFPKQQLITSELPEMPGGHVHHISVHNDSEAIIEKLGNSITYRKKEIAAGKIEEGEETLQMDLSYVQDTPSELLFPLADGYPQKKYKKTPYVAVKKKDTFADHNQEAIDKPTTHPILKARQR